jgi:bifunctional DNA-binding transcriptional regulator/antitoxin component of YhaV-PrlF toxin-antitoxin module
MTLLSLHAQCHFGILARMATVGERYQVVIERKARVALNVRPGDRAVEVVAGDRLIVTFVPARHRRSLRGSVGTRGRIEDFAAYRDGDGLPKAARRAEDDR